MADLFGIGSSALRSVQQALTTTGHNISNVNTEGYSRQRVNMESLQPQGAGRRYVGTGVTVASITRTHSQFVENEVLRFGSGASQYQSFYELSARMDNLLADTGSGLTGAIDQLFASMQDVANNPSGLPERQALLGQAQSLEARQQSIYESISSLNLEMNGRLQGTVTDINTLAGSVAQLNESIVSASASGGSPNDLLDKRDALLRELSDKIGISLSEQSDGSVNVFVGNGHALVIGNQVQNLTTVTNPYDASRLDIGVSGIAGVSNINNQVSGGELQGLLDFRKQVFDPALEQLGLLSLGLSETLNSQNQLGVDLDGNLGMALFNTPTILPAANTNNGGSAVPAVSVVDAGQLAADRYSLDFNAGTWQLTRASDGASVSGAGPLSMDGISVDVSAGVPVNGDSFVIEPARAGAAQFGLAVNDPRAIAAAAPLYAEASVGNSGSMAVAQLQVSDPADMPLAGAVTMTFNPDALGPGVPGFDVTGAVTTTVAYDPATDSAGASFSLGVAGLSFTVSGVPVVGDTLTLNNTPAGSGDNRNALAMAGLRSDKLLEAGSSTYLDVYSGLLSKVAVSTAQAESNMEVEGALLAQAENYSASLSGVNLDEEAANLLRFQQQYQAAAQIIATADLIFNTLLGATRR
ncbi:MAG: flagellar hook-associated protein FlgK [Halieaceae bacterium]